MAAAYQSAALHLLRRSISLKRGIHLTQVTTTGSVVAHGTGSGGLSADSGGARSSIEQRGSVPGVSVPPAMAGGMQMPTLRREQNLAAAIRTLAGCRLRMSGFGNGGNDCSGHPDTPDGLVPGDVGDDESEEWDQRPGTAAGSGLGKLPDGVGWFAQTAASHGKARAGTSLGKGGGGGKLSGWAGRGYARSADREQGVDGGGGRGGRQRNWADSDAAHCGRFGPQPDSLRARVG